jgi:serine/threonine protein kinase
VRQFSVQTPEKLERIVEKALAKKPDQRYASAAEMSDALLAIEWSSPTENAPAAPDPKATRMVDLPVPGTRFAKAPLEPAIQHKPTRSYGKWIGLACAAVLLLALLFFIHPGSNAVGNLPVANNPEAARSSPASTATSAAAPVAASTSRPGADAPATPQDFSTDGSSDSTADEQSAKKREAGRAKRRAEALRALDQ